MGKGSMNGKCNPFIILLALCFVFPACSTKQTPRPSVYERIDYPDDLVMKTGVFIIIIDDKYLKKNNITMDSCYYLKKPYKYFVFFDEQGGEVLVAPFEEGYPQGPGDFMKDYLTKGYVEADKELREALMTESRPSIPLKIYRDDPLFAQALFYMASREFIFYWNLGKDKVFLWQSYHREHRYKLPPERYNVGW